MDSGSPASSPSRRPCSFKEYVASELHVSVRAPSRDVLFGETRRDKLYNSLFWVGPHLERFMAVGLFACLDCFLVRDSSLHAGLLSAWNCIHYDSNIQAESGQTRQLILLLSASAICLTRVEQYVAVLQAVLCVLPLRGVRGLQRLCSAGWQASHLFDVAVCSVWLLTCVALCQVRAGSIYFWLKDITPEFLKIHALYYALDVLQKVRIIGSSSLVIEACLLVA
jgi:hypothetical protein